MWRVPKPHIETEDLFIGLEWQTSTTNLWSTPMGLGPFGTMPQTRRAPYACIVAWTAARMNKHKKKSDACVHLLDADLSNLGLEDDADEYKRQSKLSKKMADDLLLGDSGGNYRDVAFRISSAMTKRLSSIARPPAALPAPR